MNTSFKTEKYIYLYILLSVMRTLKTKNQQLELKDDLETIFEKSVTKFGNGAKLDCPKQHLGKKAYIIIRKT